MTLADLVGVVRALATIPIAIALFADARPLALALYGAAAASDAFDGWIARRTGTTTARGAFLDPLADKVLVVGVAATLAVASELDVWIVSAIAVRELAVTALRSAAYAHGIPLATSRAAKVKTALEMVGLALVVATPAFAAVGTSFLLAALVIGVLTIPHYLPRPIRRLT